MLIAQFRYADGSGVYEEYEVQSKSEAAAMKESVEREAGEKLRVVIIDDSLF